MNKSLKNAMLVSRGTINNAQSLKKVLDAEQLIGRMSSVEFEETCRRIAAEPVDGFLSLWAGLYLAATGQHAEACDKFMQASQAGCNHWRVGWYLAQSGKACGNLPLVDEACRAVLAASPEFWFARELPKHARGYYAQGDHDKSIESFFQHHPPRAKVFVEVGAFDGVHYSNVRRLVEQHGWSGISIEPVGKNFAKLEASYHGRNVRCVRACASDKDGEVEINVSTYPHLPDWGSDVASVSGEDKERWRKQYGAVWTKEKVPALRLTSILDAAGVTDVDLLSIDAEGHDLEVLHGLDFSRFQPQLIVVEYGKQREAIAACLTEQGYSIQLDNKQDLFMARPCSSPKKLDLDRFAPKERERILAAVSCRDCDDVPKVARAGEVLPGDPPVQLMHNSVKIIAGSYHGEWMTEIIRRLRGHHEPQEEKVFHEVLKTLPPRAVMIEAGSFWAYYSMWFNRAIPGAQNHLIEPNAEKFQLSQRHFALNNMKGVFTNGFIGRESRPDSVFTDWDNRRYRLPQIAIDDYIRRHDIEFVHVLRADIQGAELDLLHGCRESIAQDKIGYIILSTHGDRHPACLEFLAQHSFRVVAQHTITEGAAADGLIVACSPSMAGLDAVAISKRSQAAPLEASEPRRLVEQEIPGALQKLNPHLLALEVLPIAAGVRLGAIDPLQLVTPERFDVVAKYIYARHRALGVESGWARELYHQHIRAFSNGTCREGDGRKNGIEDYLRSFHETLDSIGAKGFDAQETLVPIGRDNVVIDGAHRVAACLFHRQPVTGLFFDFQANSYGGDYFHKRGLSQGYCDAVALEYCRLKTDTYIVIVFPSAQGRNDDVLAILNGLGRVVYEKRVTLNRHGALNLIKQIYVGEKWLGDWSNNFGGAAGKADPCFRQPGPVRVFVFETDSMESVREAKTRIRALFGIEHHSVHINDTHEQTIYLGQMLLNENSVHFLNHARPRHFERFHKHLALYSQMLAGRRLDPGNFCVDGSAVMAAYGIRDAQDLDFLHFGCDDLQTGNRDLSSHNSEVHHHVTTRDEIIFNPDNHFYYFGIKFASLDIIRKLKVKRNEGKDQKDVAAIDRLLGQAREPASERQATKPTMSLDVTSVVPESVPPKPGTAKAAFRFSNDWFGAHQPHWDRELTAWAKGRGPVDILEIGSYEGRSSCWFLTRIMGNPKSTLTCVDAWEQRSGERVYEESMEEVFQRFVKNCEATGMDSRVTVHRGSSRAILPTLAEAGFDLIYVDGDHSAEGVRADTLDAFRLLRPGGLLLWDDYFWAPSVKEGVDRACAELGISVTRLGNNASFTKPLPAFTVTKPGAKIVALVPARNEGAKIAFCFRALARVVDAIVYLDDCSDDDTIAIVESLAAECRVERIIRKPSWHRDEPGDRNALLRAGREIGGTHFAVIDADEAFTANCAEGDFLRRKIFALAPGDHLVLTWIQLWRSATQYRFDGSVWTGNAKPFVFCDDGKCTYSSEFIHTPRVPGNLSGRQHKIDGYTHGLLHFQFVNWRNLLIKQAWYRCLEHIREPQKPVAEINKRYAPSKDEAGLGLKAAPVEWLAGYPFFDQFAFDAPDEWREKQVRGWFEQYGKESFMDLDIWDVEWGGLAGSGKSPSPMRASPPIRSSEGDDNLAQGFLQLADQCFNRGDIAAARDHLERAVDVAPDRADLRVALGNIEFQMDRREESHGHLVHAAELSPADAEIQALLASVCLNLQRVEEFEQALTRALKINPDQPSALRLLAGLNLQHGRFKDAAKSYLKLLNQNESDIDSLLSLGVCFFKTGDQGSAVMMFERVLQLQPDHQLARENLTACAGVRPSLVVETSRRQTSSIHSENAGDSQAAAPDDGRSPQRRLSFDGYFQPPAGSTERVISVRPIESVGSTQSTFLALKDYEIRDFGTGLDAAKSILTHILKTKLKTAWSAQNDFWPQTLVLPVRCELRALDGKAFDETKPASIEELGLQFMPGEESRQTDIENYARQLRAGADLGRPLYVTGTLLKKLAPGATVDAKAIYMMDGARRITASALAHRRSIDALLLVHEDEYAALLPKQTLDGLRQRLGALKWFESYQSIPMLGMKGERTLRRFDLMSLPMLRDAVVMDFGCNTGQACLKAAQAGARQVIGIEGMADTFAGAQEIARLVGLSNVRYANVNFNDADFAQQIDAAWPEPVDYAFFFSVYRTKELTQREHLFRYIIGKARKGIFFEGHASQKIDTLEYYDWLFECFGVKGKFLGCSEGELRPLFYIDLVACRQGSRRGNEAEATPSRPVPPPHVGGYGSAERLAASTLPLPHSLAPTPLVSAIVSTYNNERFMEGRLRDLVVQTLGERLEIIVVDSGSQQNEGAIVKRFMESHSNIRYIRTEERERIYQAWNRGIRAARGRYITNANTDDRLRPDALEVLASELEAHPEMTLAYGDFFITNTENEDFLSHTRTGYSVKPDFAPNIMLDGCHMGPQPMWRRSLHEELGWFDESLFAAGDYEFWCRVATKHPMLHVQEFLGLYLHNAAGICNSNTSRTDDETTRVRAKYRGQLPPPAKNLPRGFFYREPVKLGRFVNIGMVTFNRLEFTKRAIPALLEHTDFPYVLTVVDNASTDGTREYLAALKQLGVIKNLVLLEENVGVAKASNVAWSQEPDAEFYLKLDNDIVIQKPGWLRKMAEVLEAVPKIGAVAYSFEPRSYPAIEAAGQVIRPKPGGTLGGACVMIPKRTERALGCWCEDYGLYGEEDFDYGIRILSKGWMNAYMEDEGIGFHLPNGRAAVINDETMDAKDGMEEVVDRDYRRFKDEQRREQVLSGKRDRYEKEYRSGQRPLFVTSGFVAQRKSVASRVPEQVPASLESQRPLRVAVFSLDHPATACAILRLIAPLNRMSRPCKIAWCANLTKQGAVVDDSSVKHADVVVIQRMFPGPENQEVLNRIFASGKPIVFELDDWFFDMPADNPHTGYAKARLPYIQQVIRRAKVVTVSTDELRQRMASLHPRVVVLPNLVNEQQWARRAASTGDKVIIGYAGTATHGRDLAMIESVLERIAAKHAGRVGFVFLGCSTERLSRLPDSRVVEFQHGYGKYVQTLEGVPMDIALAPLADNPFNRCKSNIKWVEYSAAGIAGVYADIPAYRDCVQHGETGMLAGPSADDWFKAIDELVTNESKRRRLAARARELVMREHSLAAKANLWEEVYSQVASRGGVAADVHQVVVAPKSRIPSVSIVIPTFNNLALTRQCLTSLYQTTPAGLAEVIIVDNGSTDGTIPFLEAEQNAGRLCTVLNAQNFGFARGCNQGALEAHGEFVLFLNNDTQAQPGWLEAMLAAAHETQAGVVGCKLLYPDGTIQHAGIEFINGVPDHRSRHAAADVPEVSQRREFDMVTGACFLMPKKLFLELGGFDEVFRNGVEDVDLCLRVRAAGHKVFYEPGAVVIHHEGKSQGRFNHVSENLKIFFTRWKGQFDEKHIFRAPRKARVQKSEKSLLVGSVNVCWDGSFLDLGSLSHVNRELTRALGSSSQIQLTRLGKNSVPKPLAGMKSILDCARQLRAQPSKPAQVTVRHAWPPSWDAPVNGAWVLIQPWEFGALPKEWVKNLARVDEVWVPSDYVRRVYVDSGVEPRKVHVVPNGIDPKVFQPDAKPMKLATKKSFKFLFVGGTILRKGPDVLLKAYLESFTAQDDVCLVIKDFGGQSVYAGQTFEAQVKAAQARPGAPEILYLNDELPPEALPGLYAACDCLVHPYRGEGFGLPVLEAMACGLPVVVTAGGSTDDFATDEFAYRLPSIRKGFGSSVSGMELVKSGWMLEPDHAALVDRMKWIASHREEARAKGRVASEHVRREWTWERAAQIAAARLVLLNEHHPASVVPTAPRKAKPIELPMCGKLGHLGEARELFRAGKLLASWNAVIAALKLRPYHPEGFLLLAEIAQAAGDSKQAKELADRVRRMAPKWKPAQQFAKAKHSKPAMARLELPSLPKALVTGVCEPRLSVFLITKNEERFIGQCLESVRDIASQIVVMDTGSTDWTKSIAERFGAEVHSFDWCDDFSAARNAALEKVTGDWVLMLDADEEFLPDQKEKLRQLMNDPSAIAWRLPMVDKGREEEGVSHVPRLFRNAPGLFYVGRIHEQVFSSVEVRRQEWGLENRFGDAKLLHHGYTKEMVQSRDKIARNLRLLHLAIEELPGEPNLLMNLGLELVRDGRISEGLENYAAAFAALSALPKDHVTPELRESLLTQYASHLVSAKRSSEVVRVLQSTLAKAGGLTASMHWLMGLAFIEQKQFAEGAAQMRECLAKRTQAALTPVNRNILKGGPSHCLALCLAALKQRDAADQAFQVALKEDPNARTVRFDYARFLVEGGHEVDALKWLHELAVEDASDVRVWQFCGQVALTKPEYLEFAADWTSEAYKLHSSHPAIIEQRATVLMLSGDADAALTLWRELDLKANAAHRAAMVVCETLAGRSVTPVIGGIAPAVNQEFINWYRRLLGVNAERLVAVLHQRIDRWRAAVPAAARMIEAAISEVNVVSSK